MPVGHPLAERKKVKFAELAEFDLVGPQKGSFLDSLVMKAVSERNLALKMRIRVNGFETVCSMVEASLGVGLVPERCAKRYVAGGQVTAVPLDEEWATRNWKICVRDPASQPPPVRMLVQTSQFKRLRPPHASGRLCRRRDAVAPGIASPGIKRSRAPPSSPLHPSRRCQLSCRPLA